MHLFSSSLALVLPSSFSSARANAHRPSVCCIKFDIPALSPPTTPQFSLLGKLFIRRVGRDEGKGGLRLRTVAVGRGFSQCRFHAEKWDICHHLEVDSGNGTATAKATTTGISLRMERKRRWARAKNCPRETNGSGERTEQSAVMTRDGGRALTE